MAMTFLLILCVGDGLQSRDVPDFFGTEATALEFHIDRGGSRH